MDGENVIYLYNAYYWKYFYAMKFKYMEWATGSCYSIDDRWIHFLSFFFFLLQ